MKVIVIADFKDRHTGEIHRAGKEMEITKTRFREIKSAGAFVEDIKEAADNEQV